jgi:hypothetical protein
MASYAICLRKLIQPTTTDNVAAKSSGHNAPYSP